MDGECVTAPSEREGYVRLYDGMLDVYHELTQEEFAEYEALRVQRAAQRAAQRAEEQATQEAERQQYEKEQKRLQTLAATSPDLHVVLHVPAETPHDALLNLTEERLAKLHTLRTGKELRAAEEDFQEHEYWLRLMIQWPSWQRKQDPSYESRRQKLQESLESRRTR